jgi:pimeloyl-ACP methyl ester carboxylesterase
VVLHCHGNAGNISHRLGSCKALLQSGVAVFLFDYRGYGRSEGRPTETGTYRDAQAAYEWLRAKGFSADHIIAFGESLGGGIASELAAREPLGGLVLQSTFTSIPAIGAEVYPFLPVRLISTIKYDTASRLPGIHVPVLIMHSRNDELARFHHAQTNFNCANEPKLFWELTGDHNGALEEPKNFMDGFEKFLVMLESRTPVPQPAGSSATPH